MISSLELARLCGVSQGTVDRALHNRKGISESTRRRILDTARRYGYRPHPAAREMLGGKRTLVGAAVPALNSVFFMDLMSGIRQALLAEGLRLFLAPVATREEFLETLEDFAARRCRAAVVVPPEEGIALPATITRSMPVFALLSPCAGENCDYLAPDERRTGRDAADYLLARGHRRIAHITYTRPARAIQERRAGYEEALRARGLPPAILAPLAEEALRDLLDRDHPTALFCHNDWLALSTLRLLGRAELRVPEDISVLGVDDSPTFVRLCPEITTFRYPVESIARAVVHRLRHPDQPPPPIEPLAVVERSTVRAL